MTGAANAAETATGKGRHWFSVLTHYYGRSLFVVIFVIPTLAAILFYGLIASDRYVSTTQFIVRSVSSASNEGASAFLQSFGITRTNDDAYAIQAFIQSRDAMDKLNSIVPLRQVYSRPEADVLTRYGRTGQSDTDESFYRYFRRQIVLEKNVETGITTVQVSAYRAQDAQDIARLILQLSEARVNELNARARRDALSIATARMKEAEEMLVSANVALTQYRNQSENIDPAKSAGAALGRVTELETELSQARVTLQDMMTNAPANPAIPAVRQRIDALQAQVAQQQGGITGEKSALAGKLGGYEELVVRRDLAEKAYETAERELSRAHEEVLRQQIYIETVARPNLPDASLEPRRLRSIFTVALLSLWAFLGIYLLVSGSREHLNIA